WAVKVRLCCPAAFVWLKSVVTVCPLGSRRVAVTVAAMLSVYRIVVVSSLGSPPGARTVGAALAPFTATAAPDAPTVPAPERTSGAEIVHVYFPGAARVASHVQSTLVPVPVPCATIAPVWSVTATVHGRATESRPVKRMGPPSLPVATGA